jgi:hypothetical protein
MEHDELGKDPQLTQEAEPTPVQGFENGGAPTPFSEASIVDLLQQDMQEIAATKEVFIPIKGYERSGIQVCYHLPERGKELSDLARKVEREVKDNYSRNMTIAIDTMIHLCSGIYCQPENTPEPVILDPEDTGLPVGFDAELAKLMGMGDEVQSARQVVRRLFGNNDMAILAHAERLQRWLANTKADVTLELWQTTGE